MTIHSALCAAVLALTATLPAPVTAAAAAANVEWSESGGDSNGTYYSSLGSINDRSVSRLGFAWEYPLGTNRGLEATPLVLGGVMYAVGNWGIVYALDAKKGVPLWTYDPRVDGQYWGRYACCDAVNRGIVVARGTVYVGSLDGYLHALDARSGKRLWRADTLPARGPKDFHYFISGAPVLAGDSIVIGNGGSDFTGARGFVSAFDARTGALRWRFYTVPRNPDAGAQDQPHLQQASKTWPAHYDWAYGGGGSAWDGLLYDSESRLVYIGTAHSSPYDIELKQHGGSDELYTASIVAIHAESGTLAWHYQTTPGDGWDYDATAKMISTDLDIGGTRRKVLLQANKNGFLYVLDRVTGEFISGRPFAFQNWSLGLDPKSHRPIPNPNANWQASPKLIFPAPIGAHGWQPMSFSAKTGLVYIPVADAAMVYVDTSERRMGDIDGNFNLAFFFPEDYDPQALSSLLGKLPELSTLAKNTPQSLQSRGFLRAVEPVTGKLAWQQQGETPWDGGVLSTAGNLVIRGDAAGMLNVYAADSGKLLRRLPVGTSIMAAPMTYQIDGTQYLSVLAGYGGGLLFLPFPGQSAAYRFGNAGRIVTFKLDGGDAPQPAAFVEPEFPKPPSHEGSPATIARGELLYARHCSRCHVFGRGLLPDLRRLSPATHQLFYEIVLNGAYQAKGMARWDDVLTRTDAEAIHSYLVDEGWRAYSALRPQK